MKGRDELVHEWRTVGGALESTVGCTKEELMIILCQYYTRQRSNDLPPLLPQLPVQLARNVKHLKEAVLDRMLNNKRRLWIAEEKLDGVRAKLHLGNNGNRIDSRHRSSVNYQFVEKTDALPHLRDMRTFAAGTVLDGELIMPVGRIALGKTDTKDGLTSTTATVNSLPGRAIEIQAKVGYCFYYVFDILFLRGVDIRNVPYCKRYEMLTEIQAQLPHEYIKLPAHWYNHFPYHFKQCVADGGEGIMLKRADWRYVSGGSARSLGMFKWKKYKEVDCFITGYTPGEGEFSGLIGALLVSMHTTAGAQEIGAVQPGDLPFRKSISLADGSLKDDLYGKVVEVAYQCVTKNNRLRHAVLERWRPDKTMYDCTEVP